MDQEEETVQLSKEDSCQIPGIWIKDEPFEVVDEEVMETYNCEPDSSECLQWENEPLKLAPKVEMTIEEHCVELKDMAPPVPVKRLRNKTGESLNPVPYILRDVLMRRRSYVPKKRYDVNLMLRLIMEVKKRPQLYNVRLKSYFNRRKRAAAWEEIEAVFNFKMSTDTLQKKWKVLRDTFVRELNFSKSDLAMSGVKKRRKAWRYMDQMSFLKDSVECRASTFGSLNGSLRKKKKILKIENIQTDDESVSLRSCSSPASSASGIHKCRTTCQPENNPSNPSNCLHKGSRSVTADEQFCLSLLPELQLLKGRLKAITKIKLLQVLLDARCCQEDGGSS